MFPRFYSYAECSCLRAMMTHLKDTKGITFDRWDIDMRCPSPREVRFVQRHSKRTSVPEGRVGLLLYVKCKKSKYADVGLLMKFCNILHGGLHREVLLH